MASSGISPALKYIFRADSSKPGLAEETLALILAPQLPLGGSGREKGNAGLEEFTQIETIQFHLGKHAPFFAGQLAQDDAVLPE